MIESSNEIDSKQELRWRTWQENGRRADQIADKRMRVLFAVFALILLLLVCYSVWWAKGSSQSNGLQQASTDRTAKLAAQLQAMKPLPTE